MKKLLFGMACMLFFACSDDINMFLPAGPEGKQGDPGVSAYMEWVDAIESGAVDWDEETDVSGFFRFLKGKDGTNGIDGVDGLDGPGGMDGVDGKTAYELWVEAVAKGLDDPHNAGQEWDKSKTSMSDFFRYMMGKDGLNGMGGLSAYGLWVRDVTDEDGLADPHDPGSLWPRDQTSIYDFWRYLRGENGEQGIPGISAYQDWKDAVESGVVDWDESTDEAGFFRFLKGKDGADGIDGVDGLDGEEGMDGLDGKSAYDIWVEAVAAGIEDPHNAGREWDKSKTSMSDFFLYMTGKDGMSGLSAYGLWVRDVMDEDGLVNPHDPSGGLWSKDHVLIYDFWRYLRGEDGADGIIDVPVQEPGEAGKEPTVIAGKANVIARYHNIDHSEYVSALEGSVTYQVYNDAGDPAGGATVKGLPGMDPDLEFTTQPDGTFTVLKDQLPTTGTNEQRYGPCASVTFVNKAGQTVTAESAPNTYVPQKVEIRLRIVGNITTNNYVHNDEKEGAVNIGVPIIVERRTSDVSQWEVIPTYLGNTTRYFYIYELSDNEDPTSYTIGSETWSTPLATPITYTTSSTKNIERPTKRWAAMDQTIQESNYRLWDGKPHYVNVVMEQYYGEQPHANAVIEIAPVQFHPMPKSLTMYEYIPSLQALSRIEGTFDTDQVDRSLLYDTNMRAMTKTTESGKDYTYYYPAIQTTETTINNTKAFTILFQRSSGSTDQTSNATPTTLANPQYGWSSSIYVGSNMLLIPSSRFFVGAGDKKPVGTLRRDTNGDLFLDPAADFVFSPIPITYNPVMPVQP